jgi:transposase
MTWKMARRQRAFELKQRGWTQRKIAEAFDVSEAAVSQWLAGPSDPAAWGGKGRAGRPAKLTAEQRAHLPSLLAQGAQAHGFRGDVWTSARVAKLIGDAWGVSFHKAHVTRLLKQLDWTPQLPCERADQRDETRIEAWRTEVWPALKKRRPVKA